eukprot:Platyproteum_vivax@DN227_c0_g1_i1.p1
MIPWQQLQTVLSCLPSVSHLWLTKNKYTCIEEVSMRRGIKMLDLDQNAFPNWDAVNKLESVFGPDLHTLFLSGSTTLAHEEETKECFGAKLPIKILNICNTGMQTWGAVFALTQELQDLEELRINHNPLWNSKNTGGKTLVQQYLIALFPKLSVLNGTEIKKNGRISAERYFLSHWQQNSTFALEADPDGVHKTRLEVIHPDVISASNVLSAQDTPTLSQMLVGVKFVAEAVSALHLKPVLKRLPLSILVGDMKLLAHRWFKVPLRQQKLSLVIDDTLNGVDLKDDTQTLGYFVCQSFDDAPVCEIKVLDYQDLCGVDA